MASFRVLEFPKIHLRNMVINLTHVVSKKEKKCMCITQVLPGTRPEKNDSCGSLYWEH